MERRRAKRRGAAGIGSRKALILTPTITTAKIGTTRTIIITTVVALGQAVDETRQLLLHHRDALLNDRIRLQVTRALHLVVEFVGQSFIVKRLALLAWLLEICVLAPRPSSGVSTYSNHSSSITHNWKHTTHLLAWLLLLYPRTTGPCDRACCVDRTRSRRRR